MIKDKIFGLGIGRTATKSLTAALEILGYNSIHWAPDQATATEVISGAKISRITEQRDAIIDTILPLIHYREYAMRFPTSKFILTIREPEMWLQSMRRHMIRMRSFDPTNYSAQLYGSLILMGWTMGITGDEQLLKAFSLHNQAVKEFFADKSDRFLEMNIANGDGWEMLCPFLDKNIPTCDFPKLLKPTKNSQTYNTIVKKNTLALSTMILPRMEIDHLEEWIRWHYQIGVRHFWIVCDEPIITDIDIDQMDGNEWIKKPWANYNLHLTNKEARQRINEIVYHCELKMPYINIRIYDFADFSSTPVPAISQRQTIIANKVVTIADGLVDWLGFIDTDELLDGHAIEQLDQIREKSPGTSTVRMCRQRLMGNRFVGGKSVSYRNITESWGVIPDESYTYQGNGKSFVRPGRGKWHSVHRAAPTDDGTHLKTKDIIFSHFHGLEAINKTIEIGWDAVFQWAKNNSQKSKYYEHCKILKAH